MVERIESIEALQELVDLDSNNHKLKDIAELFLAAMNDWPTYNQKLISEFIKELKEYFGTPLTIEKIAVKKFDSENAWQLEAGNSIIELIELSTRFYNEPDFDKIVRNILSYYEQEFKD